MKSRGWKSHRNRRGAFLNSLTRGGGASRGRPGRSHLKCEQLEARRLLHGGVDHNGPHDADPAVDLEAFHIHAQLNLFANGERIEIPDELGVDATGIVSPIHTHDPDNRLHLHNINGEALDDFLTLGDFFETWRTNAGLAGNNPGAILTANQLMTHEVDDEHALKMFVNGQEVADFQEYKIHEGDNITVVYTSNPLVTFETNSGPILLELLPEEAPLSVANFRNYFDRYPGTIFHRAAEDVLGEFVVQGGGFAPQDLTTTDLNDIVNSQILTDSPINETEGGRSNERGTVSMAENSFGATSQWFVNMRDNPSLDSQFKVFAVVLDMSNVDGIAALPTSDLDGDSSSNIVFNHVPYTAEAELVHVQSLTGFGWVQGAVFEDLDGNGQRDPGEPGMADVTVFGDVDLDGMLDDDETAVTTQSDGTYGLMLPAGTYHVHQIADRPFRQTHPDTPLYHAVDLEIGQYQTGIDFGNAAVPTLTAPVLLAATDSGLESDGITNFDNATADTALLFSVDGANTGAEVRLYVDDVLVGTAIADGLTQIETDGATGLADGNRQWTVTQVVDGVESLPSAPLGVVIDTEVAITTTPPQQAEVAIQLEYDVSSAEEGNAGLTYALQGAPGEASIDADTGVFQWTPTVDDVGEHAFDIVVTDVAGNSASQQVSLTVTASPQMRLRLQTSTLAGEALSEVAVGDQFLLQVFVQDLRGHDPSGVYAAFLDIPFSGGFVEPVGGISYGIGFPNGHAGTLDSAGLDEGGAFGPNSPLGSNELELLSLELRAVLAGDAVFVADPADVSPVSDNLFFDPPGRVDPLVVDYGTVALTISSSVTALTDTFNVDEDTTEVVLDVLANDTSTTETNLTITAVSTPDHGAVAVIDTDNDVVLFTPAPDFSGEASFSYEVSDGTGTATADVMVQVANVNDPPTAVADVFTVEEDSEGNLLDVLGNDLEAPDPAEERTGWTISAVSAPAVGAVQIGPNGKDLRYTPAADFFGDETFQYTLADGLGGEDVAEVTVTVTPRNDPPLAVDDSFTTSEDSSPAVLAVLANDQTEEGESLVLTSDFVFAPSDGGTVVVNGDGELEYAPALNFFGDETFQYQIEDGNGGVATAVVTVSVAPVNDPPMAMDDVYTVVKGTDATLRLLDNDTIFPDTNESLTIANVGLPTAGGSVQIDSANQQVTYQPPSAEFVGTETFTYQLSDGNGGSAEAVVTVNVEDYNPRMIAGSVGDAEGHFALGGLAVTLSGATEQGDFIELATTTDVDGHYQFADLAPGVYSLTRAAAPFLLHGEEVVADVVSTSEDSDSLENFFPQPGRRAEFLQLSDFLGSAPASTVFASVDASGQLDWYHLQGDWQSDSEFQIAVTEDLAAVQVTLTSGNAVTVELDATNAAQVKWLGQEGGHRLLQIPLSATEIAVEVSTSEDSIYTVVEEPIAAAQTIGATDAQATAHGGGEGHGHGEGESPMSGRQAANGVDSFAGVGLVSHLPTVTAATAEPGDVGGRPAEQLLEIDRCLLDWPGPTTREARVARLLESAPVPQGKADTPVSLPVSGEFPVSERISADEATCRHADTVFAADIEEILPLRLLSSTEIDAQASERP
ncbi:MAG: Ig-like domain-containing protein [Planctomycetota bacterium]|nr:Ig-like domain-containing protein [Planctomycetota bacterium]